MSEKPENPSAFPVPWHAPNAPEQGMTLRDYFAAHAPINLDEARAVHAHRADVNYDQVFLTWSQMRFAYADAMLKARQA